MKGIFQTDTCTSGKIYALFVYIDRLRKVTEEKRKSWLIFTHMHGFVIVTGMQ